METTPASTEISPSELLALDVAALGDGELIETMVAARRSAARMQSVELAAVAELARRRFAEAEAAKAGAAETRERVEVLCPRDYLYDEVAQALTITAYAADDLIDMATGLADRLPATLAALGDGRIDYAKARTMHRGTRTLQAVQAAKVESLVLGRAPRQTTGQIRAKITRLIRRLDPAALDRRRQAAVAGRDVEVHATADGTTHLTGVDLPEQEAHAAYGRINAIATALKNDGDARGIGQLRADVLLGLLRGTLTTTEPPASPAAPAASATRQPGWNADDDQIADTLADTVRVELAGLGLHAPADGDRARLLADAGRRIAAALADLKARYCVPDHDRVGYRVPAAMRRLIETRDKRCCHPGCRRAAHRCDGDHSIPFHRGGVTQCH